MRRLWVVLLCMAGGAWALSPGSLAPGVPELDEAEGRLKHMVSMSEAIGDAVSRMQATWTGLPAATAPCTDPVRLQLGWRIERFGAAWREAAQAAAAQAGRAQRILSSPTVTPLVDAPWTGRVNELVARAATQESAFRDASAWQNNFVRPSLSACMMPEPTAHPGLPTRAVQAREDAALPTAILALGDGWICPGRYRADDAVVLIDGGLACWSPTDDCGCSPAPVAAGAVLGPPAPVVEAAPVVEEAVAPEPVVATPAPKPTTRPKKKGPGPVKGPPAP